MRITSRMMVDAAIGHMQDNLERLAALQEKTASGKEFQRASDNPAAAGLALGLRSTLEANTAYVNTARASADWLDANELALKQMVDLVSRALTVAKRGLPDTQGPTERLAMGREMDTLLQQAVEVGNTSHRDSYIFAGFSVTSLPYTYTGAGVTNNVASTVGPIQHGIEPGQTITVSVDGNAAFTPLFSALVSARDALNSNDTTTLQTALGSLQTALTGVSDVRTTNGARRRQAGDSIDRMEMTRLALNNLLSHKEDASLAESISLLKHQETVYQAVLEVGSRAMPSSLFDFLR